MLYASLSSGGNSLASEMNRLQREIESVFGGLTAPTNIRAAARGSFPALNVASTPNALEVLAFAPGIDPASIEVTVDRGVLSLAGERAVEGSRPNGAAVYANERFRGKFKRALSLPDDAVSTGVEATYRDGVLRISVPREAKAQPRRIEVK